MSPLAAVGEGGMHGVKTLEAQQKANLAERRTELEAQRMAEAAGMARVPYGMETASQRRAHDLSREQFERKYKEETAHERRTGDIQEKRMATGLFSPETVTTLAQQALSGDKSVFNNLGRGVSGPQNIVLVRDEMNRLARERGYTGSDIAALNANFMAQSAAARTAAVREANIQTSVEEAKLTFPLALEASKGVPRGKFVPVNQAIQMYKSGTSDPALAKFAVAVNGAMIAYSQAMSRTGVTSVHAQQRAEALLGTVKSHEDLEARLGQMDREMDAALRAPEATRKTILKKIANKPDDTSDMSKVPGAPKQEPTAAKLSQEDAIAQAKAKLSKRPDMRDEIIKRLKDAGYDTSGL